MGASLSRRDFLRRTATVAAGSAGLAALPALAAEPQPPAGQARLNVLLITIDALRADHLGCYGYRRDTSPTIDAFAKEALLFKNAIVQGTWTLPSMASMLTGEHVGRHGVDNTDGGNERRLTEAHLTAAKLFRSAGFATAAVTDNPFLTRAFGLDIGFEQFTQNVGRDVTNQALRWLDKHTGSPARPKPFFLWLHYLDPHVPYDPPSSYGELFLEKGEDPFLRQRLPVGASVRVCRKVPRGTLRQERARAGEVSKYDVGFHISQYDAEIRGTDEELAKLFAGVRQMGLWDQCVIVVTADHGEALGEHTVYFAHGMPWDTIVRIPLLIRVPGMKAGGQAIEAQVCEVDILPTLLDLAGLDDLARTLGGGHFDGASFAQCFRGHPLADRIAFGEQGTVQLGYVRLPPWKYIEMRPIANWPPVEEFNRDFFQGRTEIREMFNIRDDPGETKNLIETDPKKAHELRVELFKHKAAMLKKRMPAGQSVIDEKTRERLRALGYVQ